MDTEGGVRPLKEERVITAQCSITRWEALKLGASVDWVRTTEKLSKKRKNRGLVHPLDLSYVNLSNPLKIH